MIKGFRNLRLYSISSRAFGAKYDLAVIGGGPGGYVAAIKAGQKGLKTVCIEKRGSLGGTCLNEGCIPSKALLNATHEYVKAKHQFPKFGIKIEGLGYDYDQIHKQKAEAVTGLTKGIEVLFKKSKVDYIKGVGKFKDPHKVEVALNEGGKDEIEAKNIIIATGSDIAECPGKPILIDEKVVVSSRGALALPKVPKNMIVVGAGVIGLELGSVYARLGAKVTVVEFMDKILPPLDDEICTAMQRILKKEGFNFLLGHKVVGGKVGADSAKITIEKVKGGKQQELEADCVLVATGRNPYTEGLGCKDIGINMDDWGRVKINDHLQTNLPHIYAIGDVVEGQMLAHKAEEEGIAAVENILGVGGHVNYDAIPGVVYTHPEIASVGLTEQELKAKKIEYNKGIFPYMANSRARTNMDTDGMVKFLSDKKTDKVLGVHILGPNAGEAIAEAVLAMEYGGSCEDIGRTCHAHPTMSEAFKEAAMAAYDKPIHFQITVEL